MIPPSLEEEPAALDPEAGMTVGSATGTTAGMKTGEAPGGSSEEDGPNGVNARAPEAEPPALPTPPTRES